MAETIGVGKSTISYDDFALADLIIIMGQNPGSNHPRMLTALEEAKTQRRRHRRHQPADGGRAPALQEPADGEVGSSARGTAIADQYLQIRLGGDMALLQALSKRVLYAEAADPGTVLDHDFLREHSLGLEAFADPPGASSTKPRCSKPPGCRAAEIDELAARYLGRRQGDRHAGRWGSPSSKKAVAHDPGDHEPAAAARQHRQARRGRLARSAGTSNVQGDRTMGIWEKHAAGVPGRGWSGSSDSIRPASARRRHAWTRSAAMRDGASRCGSPWAATSSAAISDTTVAEAAMRSTRLTVQISTKLNRSHVGDRRGGPDPADEGPHRGRPAGRRPAVRVGRGQRCAPCTRRRAVNARRRRSCSREVSIVTRLARAVLGDGASDRLGRLRRMTTT